MFPIVFAAVLSTICALGYWYGMRRLPLQMALKMPPHLTTWLFRGLAVLGYPATITAAVIAAAGCSFWMCVQGVALGVWNVAIGIAIIIATPVLCFFCHFIRNAAVGDIYPTGVWDMTLDVGRTWSSLTPEKLKLMRSHYGVSKESNRKLLGDLSGAIGDYDRAINLRMYQ